MSERNQQPSLDKSIAAAKEHVIKEGRFPRAVKSSDLLGFGLLSHDDQRAFCLDLINDPDNVYGRTLVIYRRPDEMTSPVRWFARGRENALGESFIPPHIEPAESLIETFELVSGEAIFVYHDEDSLASPCRFVQLKPHEPVYVMPGQIHSVLAVSPVVEVVEFKLVSSKKLCPQFALDAGLVDETCAELRGPQVDEYLKEMHQKAQDYFSR